MVAAVDVDVAPVFGSALPRLAPPEPLHHRADEMADLAERLGQPLYPWQQQAIKYLTAYVGDAFLYPEVAIVAARQNGKSSILEPLIVDRMVKGHRVMHTAQNRELPRSTHRRVAAIIEKHYRHLLPARRGIRFGAGQEEILLETGGSYRIVAPTAGGPRGHPNDTVILDEVRQEESTDVVDAMTPTVIASPYPQTIYLSNAGYARSVVLNALRDRAGTDPSLAYLEWSAQADRAPDDVDGWLEANPSIGHNPRLLDNLHRRYRAHLLSDNMAAWETEYLCRWTVAKTELLITANDWAAQRMLAERPTPVRAVMGVKMDPSGTRAAAVLAWPGEDDRVSVIVELNGTGEPIDVDLMLPDLQDIIARNRVQTIAFDPATDEDLVRNLTQRMHPITGREYASATERFTRLVAGRKLTVHDPDAIIAADLEHTTRRVSAAGTSIAVKAGAEFSNCAAEAAIRAVWAAAAPQPRPMFT